MRQSLLAVAAVLAGSATLSAAEVDFAREVLPILSDYCFSCHGPDAKSRKGDLRLDRKEDALRTEAPVIVAGQSAQSELIRRLLSTDEAEVMPPPKFKKKLDARQVQILKQWIDQGAKWGNHWAFDKPQRPTPPKVRAPITNPIDAFIQARLMKEGMTLSPEADGTTLIRRVTLDLTGLPPTPAEVDAFLKDTSPQAYERLVDRLLASPRYGERMVWEWLDAARYADSNGYQGDGERTMWPWRDWAVKAFNDDMPFDRFTVTQIAGDLLPNATKEQKLATGFLRNHMINGEGGRIAAENRIDYVMDMTETVGTVWLGLTFNCCRCHDHKFDPLTQKEYYGLFAYFNQTPVDGGGGNPQTPPVLEVMSPDQEAKLQATRADITKRIAELEATEAKLFPREKGKPITDAASTKGLPKEVLDALKVAPAQRNRAQLSTIQKHYAKPDPKYAGQLQALESALGTRDGLTQGIPRVMVMEDIAKPRETFVLQKGIYTKPTEKVSAGVPKAVGSLPATAAANRLALAEWLVSRDNPLTARVTVNRLWQQFFGVGLVKTAEDFGIQGERPVHPELLDWLALEFIDCKWSTKALVRLIVTSSTYRQSSKVSPPEMQEKDPQNRLLAHGPRYRMPSWMLRDQALAASGLLVEKVGGPPVRPYQPPGIWEEATFGTKRYTQDHGEALYRRSVYTFWRRIVAPTEFFDVATRQTCAVKPSRTNTPLHALVTLNDITFVEAARALAQQVLTTAKDDDGRIDLAFRRVLARMPSERERQVLKAGLARLRTQYADPAVAKKLLAVGESPRDEKLSLTDHAAYTALCLTILNLDEALTKE